MPTLLTYTQFRDWYDGKFVEVGGSPRAKNQCVDLVNAYLVECLGLQKVLWTNAADFVGKLPYEYIESNPDYMPERGDIVIWRHTKEGHIAICDSATINVLYAFGQNYPTGTPAHIQKHNYLNPKVDGWYKVNKGTMSQVTLDSAKFEELVTKSSKYDELVQKGYISLEEHSKMVSDLNKELERLKGEVISDNSEWVLNGKSVTTVAGNVTTTINYKRKQ